MLIGYARVSTHEQNLDLQEDALKAAGCNKVYTDKTSGTKAERLGLEEALVGGRPRNLDDKKKRHAVTLHSDPTNSVQDICRTLGISKATLYRYLAEQRRR